MSGILSRWSQRKLAQAEAVVPAVDPVPEDLPEQTPDDPVVDEAALLEELGLPDPDTLGKGDDFKAFLQSAVPEALRRRALRRLWRSDPALACLDGLNDYDTDFRFVSDGTQIRSAYQAGKGFVDHVVREATARPAPASAPPTETAANVTPDPGQESEPRPIVEEFDLADVRGDSAGADFDFADEPEPALPQPRRMRFTI